MHAYDVRTRQAFASTGIDLFLGPAIIALALLLSMLIPLPANAQLSGAAGVDYNYQRSMSRIIAGSASGLQVSSNSTLDIINGGRKVGSIALKEKRLIDLATMAGRAVSIPGMIAIGATVLLQYGLEKCADGTWCKPGQGEQAPNGKPYPSTRWYSYHTSMNTSAVTGSPDEACAAEVAFNASALGRQYQYVGLGATGPGNVQHCVFNWLDIQPPRMGLDQTVGMGSGCINGATLNADGMCYPIGYTPGTPPTPATSTEINQAWQRAMQANPYLQQQTWGFEDPAQQNEEWAKAMAQLAEVIGTGTVQDVGPTTTSTDSAGKVTKKQTTCTYTGTANSNMSTAKETPLNVGRKCVTTTTNPDGTTSTETTEESTAPATGSEPVKVETCGLPGKPACKIDETDTKTADDAAQLAKTATQSLDQMKTDNSTLLDGKVSEIDAKAREASAHWIKLFNVLPTYGSEVCQPPTIHDTASNRDLTFDICPHYYMAKDVFAVFIALGFLVALAFDVREAIKT